MNADKAVSLHEHKRTTHTIVDGYIYLAVCTKEDHPCFRCGRPKIRNSILGLIKRKLEDSHQLDTLASVMREIHS